MRRITPIIMGILALSCASTALAWEIKLNVEEHWGHAGKRYVTGGVPLLTGQARVESRLRLAVKDSQGRLRAVPSQFRTLARWWRADQSIRWVLLDFATDIRAGETKVFYLTDADLPRPPPKDKLVATQSDKEIVVTTGPARFVIDRRHCHFLDKVFIDTDKDGTFSDPEDLLNGSADLGIVVEDTYGEKYYSSEGVRSVAILEQGPMRVCVRARGTHRARNGKGYSHGMYTYDVFMNFYAGSTEVYVDLVLANNPPQSIGSPTFEDASLLLKLAGQGIRYSISGEKVSAGTLQKDESVCLYQDSNGADTWERCQGYDGDLQDDGWNYPQKGLVTSFRGFRLLKRKNGEEHVVGQGDHARGLVHASTDRGGVIVHTKYFWQQFPKAVEVSGNGMLRLGLFPREQKVPHFLEDTSAKGHEIILHFHPGRKGPDPESVARRWNARVYPRPNIEHQAATGALADFGPFVVPTVGTDKRPDTRNCLEAKRMLELDTLYGNSYGWQVFGERWRSQGGSGRQGARQPMNEDDYLRRWYWTGVRDWMAVGDVRSRHFRDVRCYQVNDVNPFTYKNWLEFRAHNMSEFRGDRPQPKNDEIKKYTRGIWPRCAFWLPNPEHMVLDLLYDRYLLFGDIRAYEHMHTIAAHGAYFAAYHKPVVTRAQGWGWRALFRYWELTGDKEAGAMIKKILETYSPLIGKPPLICGSVEKPNWWFTTIFCRAVAMTAVHMRDPKALALARTLAVGKEKNAKKVSTLFAALYHLTGDEAYKKAAFADGLGRNRLSAGGYLYVCDYWLLHQPPNPIRE